MPVAVDKMTKQELRAHIADLVEELDKERAVSNARQKALFEIERKTRQMVVEIDGHERKADLEDNQVDLLEYFLGKYNTTSQENALWREWGERMRRSKHLCRSRSSVRDVSGAGARTDISDELFELRDACRALRAHNAFGLTIRNYSANPATLYMRVSNKDLSSIIVGQVAGLMVSFPQWSMKTFIEDGDVVLLLGFTQDSSEPVHDPRDLLQALHAMIFDPLIYEVNGNSRPRVDAQPAKA